MSLPLWQDIDPAEAEARFRGLTRRLADLDEALIASQSILREDPNSFAAQLSLRSLAQIQERLHSERIQLVKHRRRERLAVALNGEAFVDNTASIGQLGVFLIRVQKLYSSVAQAVTTGPRQRGPVSKDLAISTNLRFADVFPSSFGMEIYINSGFDMFGESTPVTSLQTLFNLINATKRELEFARLSAELGQRSLGHLRHVLADLARADAGFCLKWIDTSGTEYAWTASIEEVPRLRENVSKFKERRTLERRIRGYLIGASLLRDRFELLTEDRQIIDGKVTQTSKPKLREFLAASARSWLIKLI